MCSNQASGARRKGHGLHAAAMRCEISVPATEMKQEQRRLTPNPTQGGELRQGAAETECCAQQRAGMPAREDCMLESRRTSSLSTA